MNAKSAINKQVSENGRKFFLSVPKMCVLLQRSNFASGTNPLARVASLFCTRLLTDKPIGLVVCGSSNAHKDELANPERHHKPFLFNVLKSEEMNASTKTAGETARQNLIGASYEERKNYMMQCLRESSTAVLVYFDEDCKIQTCGIAERGYEASLLPMLGDAAEIARRVAEEVLL